MNRVESAVINSLLRRLVQRFEANRLIALGGRTPIAPAAVLGYEYPADLEQLARPWWTPSTPTPNRQVGTTAQIGSSAGRFPCRRPNSAGRKQRSVRDCISPPEAAPAEACTIGPDIRQVRGRIRRRPVRRGRTRQPEPIYRR